MAHGHSSLIKRLFKATAMNGGSVYLSPPMKIDFLRYGGVQLISKNTGDGGTAKLYGSNVYPLNNDGEAVDEGNPGRYAATLGVPVLGGALTPAQFAAAMAAWIDMSALNSAFTLNLPGGGGSLNAMLPQVPTAWDMAWLLLVVTPSGPGPITLDAWAKFKSGA